MRSFCLQNRVRLGIDNFQYLFIKVKHFIYCLHAQYRHVNLQKPFYCCH